jgi:phosphoenolpyruvate synthase/pyruvate phosphate dikinase
MPGPWEPRSDDFYFLSKLELLRLFDTGQSSRLLSEKIRSRRGNHTRFGDFQAPLHMLDDRYLGFESRSATSAKTNILSGASTSRGLATGTARVIRHQADIGLIREGDILVTTATDPGWTPVFLVISGLVLETGGMLAHGSLLSREYGIPAVQIPDATRTITDGARITVDGNTGTVIVEDEGYAAPQPQETRACKG